MSAARPFVSVLTPTYNRRPFISMAIACFKAQTYPQDRMEWIVLDDGTDKVGDLFAASGLKNVRYVAMPDGDKLPIGAKRNRINELAKGDICVCWDDDDYYVPDRVRHAVQRLQGQKTAVMAGSTEIYMYFPDREEIWSAGPYNPNHATNGTMAYWRTYFKTHKYDDTAVKAEERQFMDDWKTPVAQLRPENVMLVINHGINTFDKRRLLHMGNKAVKKTSLKLKGFIKDKKIRDFYVGMKDTIPPYVHVENAPVSAASAASGGAGAGAGAGADDSDIPAFEVGPSTTELTPKTLQQTIQTIQNPQVAGHPAAGHPAAGHPAAGLSLSERVWALTADPVPPPLSAETSPSSQPVLPAVPAPSPSLESPSSDHPSVLSVPE